MKFPLRLLTHISPPGPFAQLKLGGKKTEKANSLLAYLLEEKKRKSPVGQVSWRECQMSLCPVIYGFR